MEAKEYKKGMFRHRDVNVYFEGYDKHVTKDPLTGKKKTEYRYTGDYYFFRLTDEEFKSVKRKSVIQIGLAVSIWVISQLLGAAGNKSLVSGIPALLSIIPLCYVMIGLIGFLRTKEPKMTIREFKFGLGHMLNTLWLAAVLWAVSAIGEIVIVISQRIFTTVEMVTLLLEIISLTVIASQWKLQRQVEAACIHKANSKYDNTDINSQEGRNING